MRFTSLLVSSGVLVSLLTPSLATAASSQALLNQALAQAVVKAPSTANGTFALQLTETPLFKSPSLKASTTKVEGSFSFSRDNAYPKNTYTRVGFSSLTTDDVSLKASSDNPTPLSLEVITHNSDTYTRVNGLDTIFSALGVDASLMSTTTIALFRDWLKIDTENEDLGLGIQRELDGLSEEKDGLVELKSIATKATTKKIYPFLVLKTEKQKNMADTLRLTVKVNPSFVNFMEQEELKATKDKTEQAAIRTSYKEVRTVLNGLRLITIINTKGMPSLQRIEFSLTNQETQKGCAYTRTDRYGYGVESSYKCNVNTYRSKTVVSGGINLSTKTVSIAPPTTYGSMKAAVEALLESYMNTLMGSSTSDDSPFAGSDVKADSYYLAP